MRSYYAHLETAMGKTTQKNIIPKPIFRSSAIFPVLQQEGITSQILFLGYWILKRNITEIASVITLRNCEGEVLSRQTMKIQEPKTYRIELSEELEKAGFSKTAHFTGSLEVEFFSTNNLVFPYPALVVNYYGPKFSTVVHTAQRVYNDYDDMQRNSQTNVPESGFNIYADEDREPFIGLINGSQAVPDANIQMEFFNSDNEVLVHHHKLGTLKPYETKLLFPAQEIDLKSFLKGKIGAAKIRFNVNWIFPRLLVGNIQHSLPALSITHSYYDCSTAASDSDYWRPNEPDWHPASLMIPILTEDSHFTNIYFYPIYSPSIIAIDVEIYNSAGNLLGLKQNVLQISTQSPGFFRIPIKSLCQELGIAPQKYLGARVISRNVNNSRLPARIKLGLDIGINTQKVPCNICTNLQPFNPPLETKLHSFKWAPVLADQPVSTFWIMNSSPSINYKKEAKISLNFYREDDTQSINRQLSLPPHGFYVINPEHDSELKDFFHGKIGWVTVETTNAYTTTYYFSENPSGVVGGDHGF